MRRLVAGFAFLASVVAFLVIAGGGLVLLAVQSSGERGAGALLALAALVALAAAMLLVFARRGAFVRGGGRATVLTAALLGMLPLATLSFVAWRFSGLPLASAAPVADWSVFGLGLFFALGAVALLALGAWRLQETAPARARPERLHPAGGTAHMPQPANRPHRRDAAPSRPVSQGRREVERPPQRPLPQDEEEEVSVTPVDLPSIGQFRRR